MFKIYASSFITLLIVMTFSVSGNCQVIRPPEGSVLNCLIIRFSWEPTENAVEYSFQVSEADDEDFERPVAEVQDESSGVIVQDGFQFGNEYIWRYRALIGDQWSGWSDINEFSIIVLPDSLINVVQTETYDADALQPGFTITSGFGTLLGFDANGEISWYIPGGGRWFFGHWDIRQLPSGNMLAIENRQARIFTPNNETIWNSRDFRESNIHHALYPTPQGTFLAIEYESQRRIIDDDTTFWQSDYIVEFNRRGEELWRWRCWDHISHDDYDTLNYAQVPPNGSFDWTHCNACPFDARDNSILLSVRELHRIIKIAYPSGEIIWSMGQQFPSGDVDFGENLEFYKQHAPQALENGNVLLYDNHWYDRNDYSRGIEIEIDENREEPAQIVWEYRHAFSSAMGDADRLPNGNTLINAGATGDLFEVSSDEELLWEAHVDLPVGTYRAERINSSSLSESSLLRTRLPRWVHPMDARMAVTAR